MPKPDRTETVPDLPFPREERCLPAGVVIARRYEIRGLLGRGGHGTAYRAFDREVGQEIALKLLGPDRATSNALVRLRRELRVARDVQSPRLVRIFDLGSSLEGAFLTMELVEGPSLRDLLREGPLSIEEAVRIAAEIFEGLAALHDASVVHRDVKPGNVLLGEGHEVKLADFGLARRLDREETQVTRTEGVAGTLDYLSPEQALGKEIRPASDLYAAGLVLFEMLAGRLPREAASDLGRRLGPLERAPNLRAFRPEVPRWLARVVSRLLEVRPADRYPSARAVVKDLRQHRNPRRYRLRRHVFRAAALALLLLPPAGVLVTEAPTPRFSHLVPWGEKGIAAVGVGGETLWTIPGVDPEIADRAALARITPHGPLRIAIVLARPKEWSPEAVSTLSFLDPETGHVVKRVKLPSGANYFPNDPPRFTPYSVKALDLFHDGVDEVLVSYIHVPEAPSYTVLYAPRSDRARVVFYARGGQLFEGAADLDRDGSPELLFAGINNGWNWVNVVAAVWLDPWPWTEQNWNARPAAAPDIAESPLEERRLLWYAVIPRGELEGPRCLSINEHGRALTARYAAGKTWTLGFDGFPPERLGPARSTAREEARRDTYRHFREAERLRRAGALDLAMAEARAAFESAEKARETWLAQYAERIQAKLLALMGRVQEAEARFASLSERAEDAPEVAYDAAVAFHLQGDLRRAIPWYERGIGRGSAMGAGKSKHEFLKGEVLALVEETRYAEALRAVDRFGAAYPSTQPHLWLYREYVRWRSGERPQVDLSGVLPNFADLERYWDLEFKLAAGGDPQEILSRVDRFLAERPETRAELLSLRAELLGRLGRVREAVEVAQAALDLVRGEAGRSIVARGHEDLLATRARRLREKIRPSTPALP
ncbi:MAG TPA: serine/threonine-protein kinase [Thermoanaerobaculia bacterium]|nr:serine/threonine-protein kinase [Thermoanaerobaculia bacterium]